MTQDADNVGRQGSRYPVAGNHEQLLLELLLSLPLETGFFVVFRSRIFYCTYQNKNSYITVACPLL